MSKGLVNIVLTGLALTAMFTVLWPSALRAQQTIPDKPDLIRVTVDHADSGILIQWEASLDPDIQYYHLYKMDGSTGQKLFTFSGSTLEYKHMSGTMDQLSYTVTAEDSSGNESLLEDNRHKAVILSVEPEVCEPAHILNWTAYEGWEGKLAGYRIYGATTGYAPRLLDFVNREVLSFTSHGVDYDSSYNYFIEAVNVSGLGSQSPIKEADISIPSGPSYLRMDYVSVVDRQTIELHFSADPESSVRNYRILKRIGSEGPYTILDVLRDLQGESYSYKDPVATGRYSFSYKVESIYEAEQCAYSMVLAESNPGTTILLSGRLEDELVRLNWTPYDSFLNGNSGYQVQRMSGDGEFLNLGSTVADVLSWSDPLDGLDPGSQSGLLQYRVLALGMQIPGAEPGISISNVAEVTLETHMKLPNAIIPGSDVNGVFKPHFDFMPEKYTLIVFDRGGRKLFESRDPGEGWDGSNGRGKYAMEGVYLYYLTYTDHSGRSRTLSGNLTVIYPAYQ